MSSYVVRRQALRQFTRRLRPQIEITGAATAVSAAAHSAHFAVPFDGVFLKAWALEHVVLCLLKDMFVGCCPSSSSVSAFSCFARSAASLRYARRCRSATMFSVLPLRCAAADVRCSRSRSVA